MKNREIKFRALVYADGEQQLLVFNLPEMDNGLWAFPMNPDVSHIDEYLSPLMQFTSLQDKNGKDIYEGDIVSITDYTSRKEPFIAEVYYSSEVAQFCGKVNGYPIDLFLHNPMNINDWIPEMRPYIQHERTIEIIGNIYEHPNLLPCPQK